MHPSPHPSPDALPPATDPVSEAELAQAISALHALAGSTGAPEATQAAAGIPDLAGANTLYDFGISLSLAIGDCAQALTHLVHQSGTSQQVHTQSVQSAQSAQTAQSGDNHEQS